MTLSEDLLYLRIGLLQQFYASAFMQFFKKAALIYNLSKVELMFFSHRLSTDGQEGEKHTRKNNRSTIKYYAASQHPGERRCFCFKPFPNRQKNMELLRESLQEELLISQ